ncbi:hypothetical protein RDWZM_010470 [Blomia tropicalis]|uniref:Uncharacterized protein n=1 Tax=Blomia tropicalis TaxID=40697 RepID=A0A9Q0LYJ2_BLOTA|nr:hypothetical protein RDWZM_010470 [Blomia tropicalis]
MSSSEGNDETAKQIIETFKARKTSLRSRITRVYNALRAGGQDPKDLYEDMVVTKYHVEKYEMDFVKHTFPGELDLNLLIGKWQEEMVAILEHMANQKVVPKDHKTTVRIDPKVVSLISDFEGNVVHFPSFWEQFEALVGGTEIDPATKMVFLKSKLKGEALKCITVYQMHQYEEAVATLKERFENEAVVKLAVLADLRKTSRVSHAGDWCALRELLTATTIAKNAINRLGPDAMCVTQLKAIVGNKLPFSMNRESPLVRKKDSSIEEFLDWLKKEVQAAGEHALQRQYCADTIPGNAELVEPEKPVERVRRGEGETRRRKAGSSSKGTGHPMCLFCGKDHKSYECSEEMSVETRRKRYCEEVNHVEINRRAKRQAFLVPVAIATIVGTVSAGITSVVQNIFRGSEIATLEAKTNQAIDNIKDDLKFKMKFQETVMKTLRQLANQTADMEKEVKREHAARIINMLTNRLNTVELAMHRFLGQGKMRIVTEDFTFLFPNISIAAGSNIPYWEFESCQYQPHEDGRPVLILKIIAPEIATQMRVLEADPFVIFKEKGDQVCRYHYHGQHYLIYNVHRSCIHNLDIHPTGFRYQAFQVYKPDECSENSKLIHLWREQECERKIRNRPRELEEVQVKRDQQFTYVYCYNQTIAIGKESQKCENVVYRIPIEQAFSVNDEHFPGRENSHQILEATISYYHTEAINAELFPSTTEYNKNFRKLEALLEQEKETLNKVTGGMIFVNQGNWVIIGIVLTLALALVIVGIYVGWKWTKRDRKNNDESQVHPIKLNTLKEEQIDVGHFYSLDDSVLPYVQFFVNKNVNGCQLLLLTANDLIDLNIHKTGHQEVILEAVELLKQLHYSFTSETLQTIALRLACRSRSLYNTLKHSAVAKAKAAAIAAAKAAAEAEAAAASTSSFHHTSAAVSLLRLRSSHSKGKKAKKEKVKKDNKKDRSPSRTDNPPPPVVIVTPQPQVDHILPVQTPTTPEDLSPVSNSTLNSVAEIIQAAKDFSKWVECHPFANQAKFTDPLKKIIKLSIEMASTAQRDQFVQGPNDVIRARCKELAEICDRMIQNLTDSLAMMAATLEIILVTRTHGEDLGMHIHSSYSGVHLIGGLQYDSPIARHGQVEEGDEIVQKRPRHCPSSTSFTPSGPFSIPNPDITYGTAKIGPEGCQRSCQRATIVNVDQYYGIPLPVIPLPENATIISTIDSSTILYETSDPLYSTGPSYPVPVLMINSIPVAGGCLAPKTSTSYTSAGGYHYGQDSIYGKARIPPPVAMLAKTSIQEPIVTVSPTKPQTLSRYNATEKRTEMDQHQTSVKTLEAAAAAASSSTTDTISNVYKSTTKNKPKNKKKSRIATTRCSSASDCSSNYSFSDSTMYTTSSCTDDDDDDDDEDDEEDGDDNNNDNDKQHVNMKPIRPTNLINTTDQSVQTISNMDNSNSGKVNANSIGLPIESNSMKPSGHCQCGSGVECTDSDSISNDDNDSAFYSGRTTSANDINGSGSGHSSGGGSAYGHPHRRSCKDHVTNGSRDDPNGSIPPPLLPPNSSKVIQQLAALNLVASNVDNPESSIIDNSTITSAITTTTTNAVAAAANTTSNNIFRSNNTKRDRNPIQPRTSAEFEALYLQQKVSNTMAKASTLPANVQPCTTTNSDSTRPTTMTSAQLSTITHLTSLAQNIRLASTVPTMSQSANNTRNSNVGGGHSTNGAQLDLVLAKKVNAKLESLNAGECSIGDHEDILYVFGGDSPNGAISNSPTRSDRPLPLLGPMILDRSALNSNRSRWTKSNGNLRENCLYTRPINDDQPSSTTSSKPKTKSQVCLELLVHLPGYYILVNKSDLMECEDSSTPKPINDQPETSILLYVFKLVTYHHLYMFAVDNPPALARWIVKFGYKFCCNPSPDQLCFTYYLSPIHVDPISKQKRLKRITPKVTIQPPTPTDEKHLTRSISSLGTNESELESDDYRDLTMDSRRKNPINNNENDRAVTFDTGNRCTLRIDDGNGDDQMYNDGRRFAKSPHPRGSARFACKPLPNNHDFIDSVIPNPTRSLAAAICELESKIALSRTSPPELPPRSSSSNGTNVAPTPTPITTTQNHSTTTATLTTTTATSTATINTMAPSNETSTSTIPRPKPRISKMASSSNNGTMSGSVSSSPNTTQMANLVSTSAAKASARAKAQSLVSAREHLAPIPVVPEKSAAISQTIQHFANLQRQNQLRRSNQQLNQQSSPSKASVKAEAKTATTNVINNSDYDYIGVQRPTLNTPKKEETNENTSNRSPGIGNPLYCVVPPTAEIAKMESNVEETQQPIQSNTSAVDREYNRLYGERAKSSRKAIFSNASTSCDERSSSSTSSSSSSGPNSTESSPPPPKEAPPPPPPAPTPTQPPIIRDCVLKSASNDNNGSSVSDDNNNVIDQPTIKQTGNPFESVRIHSPKMSGKRISTKGRLPSLPMTMKTDDQPVNNVPSQPSSPPTLLPRRSNTKQNTPPPLPTTSHPAKVATEMRRQVPPPPTSSSALSSQANSGKPITATSTNSSQSNSVRHLNRSFSDAYALKSPSRIKPRKSLESGLRMDDDCNSRVPTSTRIMVFEQLLLSATGSTNNGGETANRSAPMMGVTMLSKKRLSNVSAEAIERALAQYSTTTSTSSSSSSSDQTGAIQSPTSPLELKQNLSQLWDNWDVDNDSVSDDDDTDTITVVSNQACPIRDPPNTPIIKNLPNAIINNNNGSDSQVDPCIDEKLQSPSKLKSANHKQWEKVDQTLVETKRRLLKHQ